MKPPHGLFAQPDVSLAPKVFYFASLPHDDPMSIHQDSTTRITDVPKEHLAAMHEYHAALRRILALHGMVSTSTEKFQELSARFHAIADELEKMPRGRPFLRFSGLMPDDQLNDAIPFSPIAGNYNAGSMPLKLERDGDLLIATGVFNELYEGPNQCVHGGIVAAVYDQVLAQANVLHKVGGPTASLTTYYHKPTPLHVPLRFEARTESMEGRKIITKGRCLVDGVVVSEAEGLFIRLDPKRSYPQWTNKQQTYADEREPVG